MGKRNDWITTLTNKVQRNDLDWVYSLRSIGYIIIYLSASQVLFIKPVLIEQNIFGPIVKFYFLHMIYHTSSHNVFFQLHPNNETTTKNLLLRLPELGRYLHCITLYFHIGVDA